MKVCAARVRATIGAVMREESGAVRISSGPLSTARLAADVVLYRALRLGVMPGRDAERRIRLKTGEDIVYRLNRGDIQSIREVLIDEVYRPPFEARPRVIVDLGANIGLTSLYYHRRFHPTTLIAVEPDPSNVSIARKNLELSEVTLIEAAVGAEDGTARFTIDRDSNLGALDDAGKGHEVQVISMRTVIGLIPGGRIDLLKMDIEGGEQALLSSHTEWLSRVQAIIAEFHPDRVDYQGLVGNLVAAGFDYIPAGKAWPGSMDAFVRRQPSPLAQ